MGLCIRYLRLRNSLHCNSCKTLPAACCNRCVVECHEGTGNWEHTNHPPTGTVHHSVHSALHAGECNPLPIFHFRTYTLFCIPARACRSHCCNSCISPHRPDHNPCQIQFHYCKCTSGSRRLSELIQSKQHVLGGHCHKRTPNRAASLSLAKHKGLAHKQNDCSA